MSKRDELLRLIDNLAGARTKAERRSLHAKATEVLAALDAERPAPADAVARAYEDGALAALEICNDVRREHEESFGPSRFSAAGSVLNGVENYGQALLSEGESRVTRHLHERRREGRTA